MDSFLPSRRRFLYGAATLAGMRASPVLTETHNSSFSDIKLGVASYSLRKLSRPRAIAAIKELKTPYVNIKEFHLPYKSTPEELVAGRKEFEAAGLQIVGGGTINLKEDSDEDIRRYFEYAKLCGMPLMVIAPTQQTMPRIERFVKQYNIKAAVHNHGPVDSYFPAPQDALKIVRNMDPRVGLCIDVGHTARTGVDVVKSIAEAGSRLLDMHIKDLRSLSDKDSQCRVGEGAMPIAAIFRQLKKMNYTGMINLEYEIEADNPLPGMVQSFAFMRGVLAGLKDES
jgi:sugar phosphate isomerase/epimerase